MIQYFIGLVAGVAVGIAIGIYLGTGRKKWSELTPKQRKNSTVTISAGVILLIAGVVALSIMLLS